MSDFDEKLHVSVRHSNKCQPVIIVRPKIHSTNIIYKCPTCKKTISCWINTWNDWNETLEKVANL